MAQSEFDSEDFDRGTVVHTPESLLRTLSPDEERLVVLTCSLAGPAADELLSQADAGRLPDLKHAAEVYRQLQRPARIAAFTRRFAPPPSFTGARRLSQRLESEPSWYAAVVCRCVAPQVRDRLLAAAAIRDSWHEQVEPVPAVLDHARRFIARSLVGD